MVMLKPENRTALIDAVYLGVQTHLRQARDQRKALLILSDGGDNRSRYTQNELERVVREAGVQIYSIGIFDNYAPSPEEQMGPQLLKEICESTGGRLFTVSDAGDLEEHCFAHLRRSCATSTSWATTPRSRSATEAGVNGGGSSRPRPVFRH